MKNKSPQQSLDELWLEIANGDPRIELLKPFPGAEAAKSSLSNDPDYSPPDPSVPKWVRIVKLAALSTFYQVQNFHYPVIDAIHYSMVAAYKYRAPYDSGRNRPNYLRQENPLPQIISKGKTRRRPGRSSLSDENPLGGDLIVTRTASLAPVSAPMFCLLGTSGTGKTITILNALSFQHPVIKHPNGELQIPYIYVQCSHDGQLKGTLLSILDKIDYLADAKHAEEVGRSATAQELGRKLKKVCKKYHIALIVVDEIQNGLVQRGTMQLAVINFLVEMNNELGVAIFLVGTEDAKELISSTIYFGRRAGIFGYDEWKPCEFDECWEIFVTALWRHQWTKKSISLTPALSAVLHNLSQGIFGIAVCLFVLTQMRAIENDIDCISVELLDSTYENEFGLLKAALEDIRNNTSAVSKYGAVITEQLLALQHNIAQKAAGAQKIDTDQQSSELSKAEEFIKTNYPNDENARAYLAKELTAHPTDKATTLIHRVIRRMTAKTKIKNDHGIKIARDRRNGPVKKQGI
jgi:hypothetical protein